MPKPIPRYLRVLSLSASIAIATTATATAAEGPADGETPDHVPTLDTVVVVASRAAEPLSQVVASVAQVDREQLDRYLVRDPDSLVRYVPGVAVTSEPDRFGARGFAIRGLEGNRVRILVDGIPLADSYSVGQFSSAGRDLVDLEAIERVEIQRGPASTLYGSDALAGVVAFRTLDPEDLLARTGGERYFGLRAGFDGLDDSHLLGASWAGDLAPGWQAMALAARRSGNESGNRAWREDDAPNPADFIRESVLAKLVHDAGAGGRYTLAFDGAWESRQTAVNSLRFGIDSRYATTYRLDGDDEQQRLRASLAELEQTGDREAIVEAVQEAERLETIFNAVLRIARIEAAGTVHRTERVDLSALLADAAELYQPEAEDRGQVLAIDVEPGLFVEGDRDLLFQAAANLLDNAVKFSPDGGRVRISGRSDGTRILVVIDDTGPGVPAELRDRITERFFRAAEAEEVSGAGLGLALVAAVARIHDAPIRFSSSEPGLQVEWEFPVMGG